MYSHFLILILSVVIQKQKPAENQNKQKLPQTSLLLLLISALLIQILFSQFQNLQSLSGKECKAIVTE